MSVIWVDIIKDIVDDVRADAGLSDDAPHYLYGTFKYISSYLNQQDKVPVSKVKKYPLIALFMPFTESNGDNMFVRSEASLTIGFITSSNDDYTNPDRYTNSFSILYPLYELFLQKLIASKRFDDIDTWLIPHDKTDLLNWSSSNKNIINDKIDAIEIKNLELKLNNNTNTC